MKHKMSKNRILILILLICISVSCFCVGLISAKYASFDWVTKGLNLLIKGEQAEIPPEEEEVVEGEELEHLKSVPAVYHVLYVTYDGEKNVIAAEDVYSALTDIASVRGEIASAQDNSYYQRENCEFIGWSTTGIVAYTTGEDGVEDYSNNLSSLYNGNRVSIAKLVGEVSNALGSSGVSTFAKAIDYAEYGIALGQGYVQPDPVEFPTANALSHVYIILYDMYKGGPVLTVKPNDGMESVFAQGWEVWVNPYVWAFASDISNYYTLSDSDFNGDDAFNYQAYLGSSYLYLDETLADAIVSFLSTDESVDSMKETAVIEAIKAVAKETAEKAASGEDFSITQPNEGDFLPDTSLMGVGDQELYDLFDELYGSVYARKYSEIYEYVYNKIYATVLFDVVPNANGEISVEIARLYTDFYAEVYTEVTLLGYGENSSDNPMACVGAAAMSAIEFIEEYLADNPDRDLNDALKEAKIYALAYCMTYICDGATEPTASQTALELYNLYYELLEAGKTSAYAQGYLIASKSLSGDISNADELDKLADICGTKYSELRAYGYDPEYCYEYTQYYYEYTQYYIEVYILFAQADENGALLYNEEQAKLCAEVYTELAIIEFSKGETDVNANIILIAYDCADYFKAGKSTEFAYCYGALAYAIAIDGYEKLTDEDKSPLAEIADQMASNYSAKISAGASASEAQAFAIGFACLSETANEVFKDDAQIEKFVNALIVRGYTDLLGRGYQPSVAYVNVMNMVGLILGEMDFIDVDDQSLDYILRACYIFYEIYDSCYEELYAKLCETAEETNGEAVLTDTEKADLQNEAFDLIACYAINASVYLYEEVRVQYGDNYAEHFIEAYVELLGLAIKKDLAFVVSKDWANAVEGEYDDLELVAMTYAGAAAQRFKQLTKAGAMSQAEMKQYVGKYIYGFVVFNGLLGTSVVDSQTIADLYAEQYMSYKAMGLSDAQANGYAFSLAHFYCLLITQENVEDNVAKLYATTLYEKYLTDYDSVLTDADFRALLIEEFSEEYNAYYEALYNAKYAELTDPTGEQLAQIAEQAKAEAYAQVVEKNLDSGSIKSVYEQADAYVYEYYRRYAEAYANKLSQLVAEQAEQAYAENFSDVYALANISFVNRFNEDADLTNDKSSFAIESISEAYVNAYITLTNAGYDEASAEEIAFDYANLYGQVVIEGNQSQAYAEAYAKIYCQKALEEKDSSAITNLFSANGIILTDTQVSLYIDKYASIYAEKYELLLAKGVSATEAEAQANSYANDLMAKIAEQYFAMINGDASLDPAKALEYAEAYSVAYLSRIEQGATGAEANTYAEACKTAYVGMMSGESAIVSNELKMEYALVYADKFVEVGAEQAESYWTQYVLANVYALNEGSENAVIFAEQFAESYFKEGATSDYALSYATAYLDKYQEAVENGEDEATAMTLATSYAEVFAQAYVGILEELTDIINDTTLKEEYAFILAQKFADLYGTDPSTAQQITENYANAYVMAYELSITPDSDYNAEAMKNSVKEELTKGGESELYAEAYAGAYVDAIFARSSAMLAELYHIEYTSLGENPTSEDIEGALNNALSLVMGNNFTLYIEPFATYYAETYARVYFEAYNSALARGQTEDNAIEEANEIIELFEIKFDEVHDDKRYDLYQYCQDKEGLSDETLKTVTMYTAFSYAQGYAMTYIEAFSIIRYGVTDQNGDSYSVDIALKEANKAVKGYDDIYMHTLENAGEELYGNIIDLLKELPLDISIYNNFSLPYAQSYTQSYLKMLVYLTYADNTLTPAGVEHYATLYASVYAEAFTLAQLYGSVAYDYEFSKIFAEYFVETYHRLVSEYGANHKNAFQYARAYTLGFVSNDKEALYQTAYSESYNAYYTAKYNELYTANYNAYYTEKYNELYTEGMTEEQIADIDQQAIAYAEGMVAEQATTYAESFASTHKIYATTYVEAYVAEYAVKLASTYTTAYKTTNAEIGNYVGMGVFINQDYHKLTSDNQALTFRVHTGLHITSGSTASVSTEEIDGVKYEHYLYLFGENVSKDDLFTTNSDGVSEFDKSNANGYRYNGSQAITDAGLTLYAYHAYVKYVSSGGGGCFTEGTMITLADGSKIPVEQLTEEHILRVYDHENGCYTTAPILFIENDGVAEYEVIYLTFSDGTVTKAIYEHAYFDLDLNKYVYITADNYLEFVGHRFAKEAELGYEIVTLEEAFVKTEQIGCYSLATAYHMNYFVDGLFSMPGGITGLFNYFEYGDDLAYDQEAMQRDIELYGLYTAEDFADYIPEEVFNELYPIKYLKISVAKGLMTFEDIITIINRYVYGHDLV